jgi:hypothetical protein
MIKIFVNTWTRFLSTRGSSISQKIDAIFSVNAVALATLNFWESLTVWGGDLKPSTTWLK